MGAYHEVSSVRLLSDIDHTGRTGGPMNDQATSTRAPRRLDDAIEVATQIAAAVRGIDLRRDGADSVTIRVGPSAWSATVVTRDALSIGGARTLIDRHPSGACLIVAHQISADAKDFLADHNERHPGRQWSWLDQRGELALHHGAAIGVVDRAGPAHRDPAPLPGGWRLAAPISGGPIRGRAGIGYGVALLLSPTRAPSIREVARRIGMSHGAVGTASLLLREYGLVRSDGRPQVPELFEAVAKVWQPPRVTPVRTVPSAAVAARLGAIGAADDDGWCIGGDNAALAWGAPVMSGGSRPWIWVPDLASARRAERALVVGSWDDHAAVIAVAPTPLVGTNRCPPPRPVPPEFLPTAHPVFLALELAQDPTRGREILAGWQPVETEFTRVW